MDGEEERQGVGSHLRHHNCSSSTTTTTTTSLWLGASQQGLAS
jgi:hypothetical protein